MDQRLNLGNEVRELKLGSTFNTPKPRTSFHTLKYDFKPASVDLSKTATLDVSSNNQVTVTMPHLNSSGVPKTVFKGNQRNYTKECVLIIDKVTGEITLEKLHHNIQVKKTRSETNNKSAAIKQQPAPLVTATAVVAAAAAAPPNIVAASGGASGSSGAAGSSSTSSSSSSSIVVGGSGGNSSTGIGSITNTSNANRQYLENSTKRVSTKTRVSTGIRKSALGTFVQRHSPIQGSPSYPHHRSPQQAPAWNANNGQSTLPSIPIIGMDEDFTPTAAPTMLSTNTATTAPSIAAKSMNTAANSLPSLNTEQSHQFNSYHLSKPTTKSSTKLTAPPPPLPPSVASMSQSSSSNLATGSQHSSSSMHNLVSNSFQNSPYDKMRPRQSTNNNNSTSNSGSRGASSGHHHHHHHHAPLNDDSNEIGVLSTSDSSDSSDSDSNSNSNSNSNSSSDSDSNSDDENDVTNHHHHNHNHANNAILKPNPIPVSNGSGSLPALLLDEDLRLSSNSSDSDDD